MIGKQPLLNSGPPAAVEKALAFFAFLMGFGPPLSIFVANVGWIGFAVFGFLAMSWEKQVDPFPRTPMEKPVLLCMVVWLITSLSGIAPWASLQTFPSTLHFIVFFLLLWVRSGRYVKPAWRGYLWGAGLAVVYGLAQYLLWSLIKTYSLPWLGLMDEKAHRYFLPHTGRIHGAVHPLTYAEVILPLLFFVAVDYLDAERESRRALSLAGLAAIGLALLLSQSRGPWLGAVTGLAVIGALHKHRLRLLAPLFLFASILFFHPDLRPRAATFLKNYRDESTTIRLDLWKDGLYIARRHFWNGVGPGQIRKAMEMYRGQRDVAPNVWRFAGDMHNLFLQQLASQGIFGLGSLVWLLAVPLWMSWKSIKNSSPGEPSLSLALLAFFCAFPVLNLTERALEDAEVALIFWILVSMAALFHQKPPAEPLSQKRPLD